MAQSLAQIMSSLSGQYDPQAKLIQDQQAALPGQETAAIGGLDQAKTNAFQGINDAANARGMSYSGAPIKEQQVYTGERYLPALAGIKQNTQQQGYQLQSALLGVRQQQGAQAQGIQADQNNREQQQRQYEQQRQDGINQFNRQLQAQQQAAAQSRAQATQQATAGFNVDRDKSGGYAIKQPNGKPGTLFQYVQANGGGWKDVIKMLAGGSRGDAQIADELSKTKLSPQALTKKYPYIFGTM